MARERLAILARSLAALVGTFPLVLLVGVAIAVHAPLKRDLRFALGYGLVLPTWVAMCLAFPGQASVACLAAVPVRDRAPASHRFRRGRSLICTLRRAGTRRCIA
jgi:hypothetical protein